MAKGSVYVRPTTGGSRRRYVKATRGSTGPFFLRYEINGKRVWERLGTRTYSSTLKSSTPVYLLERGSPVAPLAAPAQLCRPSPRSVSGSVQDGRP
jgi:hypothetical protein